MRYTLNFHSFEPYMFKHNNVTINVTIIKLLNGTNYPGNHYSMLYKNANALLKFSRLMINLCLQATENRFLKNQTKL